MILLDGEYQDKFKILYFYLPLKIHAQTMLTKDTFQTSETVDVDAKMEMYSNFIREENKNCSLSIILEQGNTNNLEVASLHVVN